MINVIWAEYWDDAAGMPGGTMYDGGRAETSKEAAPLLLDCIDYHSGAGHPGQAYLTDDEGRRLGSLGRGL